MSLRKTVEIFGLKISDISAEELAGEIKNSISTGTKISITYATQAVLNKYYEDKSMRSYYDEFSLVHADGVGVYLASKILYSNKGFSKRLTGSDFYEYLAFSAELTNAKLFLFGDTQQTIDKVGGSVGELKIVDKECGFGFDTASVVAKINASEADIAVVGLGSPLQEQWINENRGAINSPVVIAVGEGIKIFSGTKNRGPKIVRKIGLEWMIRLITNPKRLWKRYLIGIPLFIYRIIKVK